jgi:hypothetical protein
MLVSDTICTKDIVTDVISNGVLKTYRVEHQSEHFSTHTKDWAHFGNGHGSLG